MAEKRGKVIALDGPDGVGKTTQLTLLANYLQTKGYIVHTTRQSGGTPIGEELRKASLSSHERSGETDLFISQAMGQALSEDIHNRKARGETILIDRSPLAFVAYNSYGSQMADPDIAVRACEQFFMQEEIDTLLFLDASQPIIDGRRQKRGAHDYFETRNTAFHERVRDGYAVGLAFLRKHKEIGAKVTIIDATKGIDTIHQAIVSRLGL